MFVPIFDTGVCIYDFDEQDALAEKPRIDQVLDELFNLPDVQTEKNVEDAQGGRALSSVHLYETHAITDLLDFKNSSLGVWILKSMFDAALQLGFNETRDIRKFKFHRSWANKMYKNCDAIAHRHALDASVIPHVVAIYYHDVPDNSADLIFLDDKNHSEMRGGRYYEYPEEKQFRISPKAGRLVCHDAKFLHATSAHDSESPRTCLIVEVGFPPLS